MLRPAIFIVAVLICSAGNSIFSNLIDPTISANVAVGQLANDEIGAVSTRGYTSLTNFVPVASWSLVVVFGVFLFYRDIKELYKKMGEQE